ncbi:MAG: hypothetical protein O7F71_13790 [Gammaproteobacteria bacterium]|nr:hypothetical protein [Gammaproteobacteria bacterium]
MTTVVMADKTQQASAVTADPTASWHTEAGVISVANPPKSLVSGYRERAHSRHDR